MPLVCLAHQHAFRLVWQEGGIQFTGNKPPRFAGGEADDLVADLSLLRTQNSQMRDELQVDSCEFLTLSLSFRLN